MVDVMCKRHGLSLTETGVGFKYICEEMLQGDVLLGFEESGGIGFPGHVPERDGILAGLMILELLATERTPLTKLLSELTKTMAILPMTESIRITLWKSGASYAVRSSERTKIYWVRR